MNGFTIITQIWLKSVEDFAQVHEYYPNTF